MSHSPNAGSMLAHDAGPALGECLRFPVRLISRTAVNVLVAVFHPVM